MSAPGNDLQARAKALGEKAKHKLGAMAPATRIALVVAVLVVGVGGFFFIRWASTPTYAPLFSNLAGPDASAVIDKLNAAGVPYELSGDGSEILVPKDQVYSQRIALSADGLPSSPDTGYSLLDDAGVTTSEFRQRIDYQRALEGELDNTINSIDGVQAAAVHLAMPSRDVFDDGSQPTTASVLVTMSRGDTLGPQQVDAIVNLVASSVPGLSTDNVTVSDSSGKVLSTGGDAGASGAADQAVSGYEQRVTANLQNLLDGLVGPGNALVTVSAQVDTSKQSTTTRTYTSAPGAPPLAEASSVETYSGGGNGAGVGGVAGVVATPAATTAGNGAAGGNGSYSKSTVTKNNAVGTVDQTTETPPGQLQRLSVAVAVDPKAAPSVSTAAITALVTSAAGIDATRGDTLSVQQVPIDRSAQQAAADQAAVAAAAEKAAESRKTLVTIGGLGIAGLVLLGLFGAFLARRRRRRSPPQEGLDMLVGPEDPLLPPEPEPLVPDRPWEAQSLDATRKELHNLAVEKPGDVARVLRSWLAE